MVLSKSDPPPSSGTEARASSVPSATNVGAGGSSAKPTPSPDPRWPYLSRWSGKLSLAETIGIQSSAGTTSPPSRPASDSTEALAAVLEASPIAMTSLEKEAPVLNLTGSVAPPLRQGSSFQSSTSLNAVSLEAPTAVPESPPVALAKATLQTGIVASQPRQGLSSNSTSVGASSGGKAAVSPDTCWNGDNSFLAARIGEIEHSPQMTDSHVQSSPTASLARPEAETLVETNYPLPGPATAPLVMKQPQPEVEIVMTDCGNGGKPLQSNLSQPPPLKGAWANKLKFLSTKATDQSQQTRSQSVVPIPGSAEDETRFPWAAKMNPSSRNLYRAVEPEYLEDGTPKVTIPHHVLLQGLENQKEYVLGQFFRCSPPPGGLIYAVFNKVWGRNCKITIKKLGASSYLFHIPEESTRNWVLQRGLWHVDDCLMFVAPWTPQASLAIPEIKTIPVWVTLKNIPSILYSIRGISHIASGLGAPMATHKPRLDPIFMGEAKILVEVELSKAFPPRIAADDKNGCIWMVDVEYAWLPSTSSRCGQLGHKVKRCLQPVTQLVATTTNTSSPTTNELPPTDPICKEILDPTLLQTPQQPASPSLLVPSGHISYSAAVSQVLPTPTEPLVSNSMALLPATLPMASTIPQEGHVVSTKPALVLSVSEEASAIVSHPIEITPHIESVSTESPRLEIAPLALIAVSPRSLASSHREGKQHDTCLGTNQFASLASSGGDEIHSDLDVEPESMDFMTPPGKRILRDRPVKPTTKAIENSWQVKGRGKGGRGRGGRGGRG